MRCRYGTPPGSRVLDIGCGDGGLVDRLTERGFDAFGVDPQAPHHPRLSRERIEQATDLGSLRCHHGRHGAAPR